MNISVIIPTYREPEYLDLCLRSCIEGQTQQNEIIVVVDGYYDDNKEILNKWIKDIKILNLEQNCGLPYSTNVGVYNASNEWILIVNDDNVFPKNWDKSIMELTYLDIPCVISPNQIEPNPSIFPQFIIKNLGKNINEFNLEQFWEFSDFINTNTNNNKVGGTLPIFMKKEKFIAIGGWDEHYPTNGVVADWDFYYKCELNGLELLRDYKTHFYHFAQISTGTQRQNTEKEGHEYFYYKWRKSYIPLPLRK